MKCPKCHELTLEIYEMPINGILTKMQECSNCGYMRIGTD